MNHVTNELLVQRRDFLKAATATLAWSGFGAQSLAMQEDSVGGIPTRPLGRTGERVPIVGLGGYHIGVPAEQDAIRIMHEAIDGGMTFFDNAWDYHDGGSEEVMGKALATGGRRDKVFLMTKVCDRDYQGAMRHLEDSLRRLKTDRIDLWQFHEINWDVDPEWVFEKGGIKAAIEARQQGKVRYIGFTGHRDPAHHLKMLARDFEWDTVQMPINLLDAHYRSFQTEVLPKCRERNIAVIGMKALGSGQFPQKLELPAATCRRFALTLPIATLVCGIQSLANLRQDLEMARTFQPISQDELKQLLADTQLPGSDGKLEPWKTTDYGGQHHRDQHADV